MQVYVLVANRPPHHIPKIIDVTTPVVGTLQNAPRTNPRQLGLMRQGAGISKTQRTLNPSKQSTFPAINHNLQLLPLRAAIALRLECQRMSRTRILSRDEGDFGHRRQPHIDTCQEKNSIEDSEGSPDFYSPMTEPDTIDDFRIAAHQFDYHIDIKHKSPRIFACENRAGRCRWSAGFLGDFPFAPNPSCAMIHFTLIGSQDLDPARLPPRRTGFNALPDFHMWEVGIVPDDATGRRVFSGISRFPRRFIPAPLHTHLGSPYSAEKTSLLRAAQISSLTLQSHLFFFTRGCSTREHPAVHDAAGNDRLDNFSEQRGQLAAVLRALPR
ncbi:hypothetical protein PR048_001169 [Dryococelus australis]|uniref:Uncharacterized protein n=1 Tax=Dryococelus australis TaxID=614101 RepID=A0ABQ9IGL8_9NEOP|nr:hypothetical protein PR048_001169 [Dryococelus australis]